MDVAALIGSFSTGTYTVTRRARGSVVRGRVQDGTQSTVSITASVSPAMGDDLERLPEGRNSKAAYTLFTSTRLYTGGQGEDYEPDWVTIDGFYCEVQHVEKWTDSQTANVGYKAILRRSHET